MIPNVYLSLDDKSDAEAAGSPKMGYQSADYAVLNCHDCKDVSLGRWITATQSDGRRFQFRTISALDGYGRRMDLVLYRDVPAQAD